MELGCALFRITTLKTVEDSPSVLCCVPQEQESGGGSSSSSESEGGEASGQQQAPPIPAPSLHDRGSPEPTDELTNQDDSAESQMPNTQDLFGDSS